jgi:hypothetical protein
MNGGDLTRSTFRPHRHYSGVRMQQGRVQLDADWNEQVDLAAHRDRTESRDVIGAAGVPKVGGGFELTVSPDGQDLLVSPGHAWVGGHLCEVDGETTAVTGTPTTTSVTVASLLLDGVELTADTWVEVAGDAGAVVTRAASVDVAANTVALDDTVDSLSGSLVLRRRPSYSSQPDLPEPEHTTQASATDPRVLDLPEGAYLAYLDVRERTVTALDDPTLTEPALGVDTTTRTKVVWQLRLLDLAGVPGPVDCDTDIDAALAELAPPTGRMAARAEPPAGSEDLCRPTPAGGYIGLENQLYRVHVHDLDGSGSPVVLWSRENASVLTGWTATLASDVLEVSGIGKDAVLGFRPGDWVELFDDTCTLHGRPGTLVRLLDARDDRLVLDPTTPTGSTDIADFPRNPQVRRWDSPGPVAVTADEWLALEEGVEVLFPAGGTYRRHDHWLVPARSVLADVDWPRDSGGEPIALPPAGITRAIGRVGIVTRTTTGLSVTDCRDRFPSLTTLTAEDVGVDNDVCHLPGVETVQDAIDALCRANDLRRHNRLLHGYGIVCGLAVRCGEAAPEGGQPLRRFVTLQPGSAIDPDGYDLEVREPVEVDVLRELEGLGEGVLDQEGDGEVCLVLRNDPERGPAVVVTKYVAPGPRQFLEGTLLKDVYDDCIAKLFTWVKAQLAVPRTRDPEEQKRSYLLRTALTNLLTYVANPKSGGNVFVAENEHEALVRFYEGLKNRLRSHTFCAMFDDARPYPDYPESLAGGIRTIAGSGMHARVRIHPSGREAWTTGGGVNPLEPATMINRYSLDEERLLSSVDPVGSAAAAVSDVAFSPDGRLVYAVVPTRDGNDTLFRVGEIGREEVKWRPATTICGVKLVTLATTEADPDHVYAVGLRRTSTAGKALSLREFTGAGIWRINPKDVPEGLGPIASTASLNTVGHLAISPKGEAVFTVGQAGGTAQRYDRLVTMTVPSGDLRETRLDGSGSDDLALALGAERVKGTSAWTVIGSGRSRQVVGVDLDSGEVHARISTPASGRLSLQAVEDRLLVTDSNASLARVLDCSRQEFVDGMLVPVQVAPTSITALPREARQVVVLNMVSNSLTAIDADIIRGDRLDLSELVRYRRAAVEAFADLVGGLAQYLKDCLCDHFLVSCPPELENKDLDLAAVSIRGGSVYKVCNFSRRRYVKSFPTVGYWLSLLPVLPALREAVARACCTVLPEVFARYTTTRHDDADDRIDAMKMLRFLELAQTEDPMTRLKNLDWDFLSVLRGANTGDWGDSPEQPVVSEPTQPVVAEPRQPGVTSPVTEPVFHVPVRETVKPKAAELIIRNLLVNPTIRGVARDVSTQPVAPAAVEPRQVEALLGRVEALEAELATLRKPTTRTRKATPKPEQ